MMLKRVMSLVLSALAISACLPSAPINLQSAITVVHDDGSGSNTFRLVVPNRTECQLIPLRPSLSKLKDDIGSAFHFARYNESGYSGFELTYEFKNTWQIPEQIEQLKRTIIELLPPSGFGAAAVPLAPCLADKSCPTPTPGPAPTPTPRADVENFGAYDPNQLSLRIDPPIDTATGKEWKATIKINPMLLTSLSAVCSVPRIDYELIMPGEINNFTVHTNAFEDQSLPYSHVKQIGSNSIQWTLEPRSMGVIVASQSISLTQSDIYLVFKQDRTDQEEATLKRVSQLLQDEARRLTATDDTRAQLGKLYGNFANTLDSDIVKVGPENTALLLAVSGPVYTLTVTSSTPSVTMQVLTRIVAPIVGVIGGILAIIISVIKIRQSLGKRRQSADE